MPKVKEIEMPTLIKKTKEEPRTFRTVINSKKSEPTSKLKLVSSKGRDEEDEEEDTPKSKLKKSFGDKLKKTVKKVSGFKAIKKIASEMESGGEYIPNFFLSNGEEAEVWFVGSRDEPEVVYEHTYKPNPKDFRTVTCAAGQANHTGCVACFKYEHGDKRAGKPTAKSAFSIYDTRYVHRVELKEKNRDGEPKIEFKICSESQSCKCCRMKIPRERSGLKKWITSVMWGNALGGVNSTVGQRCFSCKRGKIKVLRYVNDMGREVDIDDEMEIPEGVDEEIECNRCQDPVRSTIWDVPITIKRNGEGKSTSYSFVPGTLDDEKPDFVEEAEPFDLKKACRAYSSDSQARRMGVPNPFGHNAKNTRGGSDSDGETNEEDEAEEYDESGGNIMDD